MADVQFDGYVRELNLLRGRTKRLYGRSHITLDQHNRIMDLADQIEEVLDEVEQAEDSEQEKT